MSNIPLTVLKLINEAIDVIGEKALVALVRSIIDGSKAAQLARNKELGKRAYRRPK